MPFPASIVDRSAVLLLGVCAGAAIGFSFAGHAGSRTLPVTARACDLPRTPLTVAPEVSAARFCAAPAQTQLLQTLRKGAPVRVAVFGDSYGDGVWSGLQRQLPRAQYDVVKYSQPATGFTRYKRLNLETQAADQLGTSSIDIAVISFGANDAQGINTDTGEHAPLLSDRWKAQIGLRLGRFVGLLRKHHAMLYWVGLPRMREAQADSDMGAINAFYASEMAKLEVPFIDTRPLASDAKGQYAAYLPDPKTGERTLVREGDGVHMSMTGYLWITKGLAERIRSYVDATRAVDNPDSAAAK
jgi:uncharacterized protein